MTTTTIAPDYNTDCYFSKSRESLELANRNPTVLYQVFQRKKAVMAGGVFVEAMLHQVANHDTELWLLPEGSLVEPYDPIMYLKAKVQDVIEMETEYLGILARCIRAATNVRNAVQAANGKPVLFFPARFDVIGAQVFDGYGAGVGQASGCATAAQTEGFNLFRTSAGFRPSKPVGTMPHALIAAFGGDTVQAALAFADARPNEEVWVLVDFENNCAETSVKVLQAFQERGLKLTGVRLDTSDKLVDVGINSFLSLCSDKSNRGVNGKLVRHVRQRLDEVGGMDVKIAVSGGFTPEKIASFEEHEVPADVYACGESMISGSFACTSDIVAYFENAQMIPCGKVGRSYKPSSQLIRRI